MHVHVIAVAGTGMGALAGLLKDRGHRVTGSDTAFYPPMGPALKEWGIELMEGFGAENLSPTPDLVVVGNVCRPDHVEARAAIDGGMNVTHIAGALADHVLGGTAPLVVGGTHGKTTTASMCAWILEYAKRRPGFFIGGIPKNFARSFRNPPTAAGRSLSLVDGVHRPQTRLTPFVMEGDEYDTAFFEKTPKFWHYRPQVGILTSCEHDHIDIYPDLASYEAAFSGFISRIPADGLLVVHGASAPLVRLVAEHKQTPVAYYAIDGDDTHGAPPHWLAYPIGQDESGQSFDLFAGGVLVGRGALPHSGEHNLRNAIAAVAACCQGYAVEPKVALAALTEFTGVARRQEVIGEPKGIRVIDDFAHHPTAVRMTLDGLRKRYRTGKLWAIYEPRTATACRRLHQTAYETAFSAADEVILAPLGRTNLPADEILDRAALLEALKRQGLSAEGADGIDAIVARLASETKAGDTVALLSNGSFGRIHERLLEALDAS